MVKWYCFSMVTSSMVWSKRLDDYTTDKECWFILLEPARSCWWYLLFPCNLYNPVKNRWKTIFKVKYFYLKYCNIYSQKLKLFTKLELCTNLTQNWSIVGHIVFFWDHDNTTCKMVLIFCDNVLKWNRPLFMWLTN